MKITAQTEAVSSPREEKWHLSQHWRQNTFRAGQKLKADWKYDLHNLGAGRKSRQPTHAVRGHETIWEIPDNMKKLLTIAAIALVVVAGTVTVTHFTANSASVAAEPGGG